MAPGPDVVNRSTTGNPRKEKPALKGPGLSEADWIYGGFGRSVAWRRRPAAAAGAGDDGLRTPAGAGLALGGRFGRAGGGGAGGGDVLRAGGFGVALAFGREEHRHAFAHEARLRLHLAEVGQAFADLPERRQPDVLVRHLAAAEEHGELDLVALGEEFLGAVGLDGQVVRIDLGAQTDFFKLAVLAVAAGFLLFLFLLVLPLAIVHDPADGGLGLRRDLHQVQAGFARAALGFVEVDDADLFVVVVNQENRRDADEVVDAQPFARVALRGESSLNGKSSRNQWIKLARRRNRLPLPHVMGGLPPRPGRA